MRGLWLRTASILGVATVVLMAAATGAYASSDATVVRTGVAGGVGWHSAHASCPKGQFATGGGMALSVGHNSSSYQFLSDDGPVNSSGTFAGTTTGTVPVGWYGTAYVEAGTAEDYVWAICSPSKTTVIRKTIGSGSHNGFHSGYAKCLQGQTATGGGLGVDGGSSQSNYETITDDGPVNSSAEFSTTTTGTVPVEWLGTNDMVTDSIGYVWAVCSSHLATTVVRSIIGVAGNPGFYHAYARCPQGVDATGGGVGLKGGSELDRNEIISSVGPLSSSGNFNDTTTGTVPLDFYGVNDLLTTHTTGYIWAVCG